VDLSAEAQKLNARLEKEGDLWVAVLNMGPGEDELEFPAPSEQEALDEVRAYQAVNQAPMYKFGFDPDSELYSISVGDSKHEHKLLAQAFREAQKAYAATVGADAPKPEEPAKTRTRRKQAPQQPGVPADAPLPPGTVVAGPKPGTPTSGIGNGPGQLPPAALGGNADAQLWDSVAVLLEKLAQLIRQEKTRG
jgi:hypothetical protein